MVKMVNKKLIMPVIFLLLIGVVTAYQFKTTYNPFTGRLDYHVTENFSGYNVSGDYIFGNGSMLTSLTGGGDILGINTNGPYLTGGCGSGTCSLLVNTTVLNTTINSFANTSWNQTKANALYAGIEWDYNQTTATYNLYNIIWSATYNLTYHNKVTDNESWNQSQGDLLYAGIEWDYNQTLATYNTWNDIWIATYNSTYHNKVTDNESWNESYADTLYAPIATGNDSWNQSLADTLYADISVTGDNASWNESYGDTLYAPIGSGNASWNQSLGDSIYVQNSDLPLANKTKPYCGNITGNASDLCTLTDTTYTAGSNLTLNSTTFDIHKSSFVKYLKTFFIELTDNLDWGNLINKPVNLDENSTNDLEDSDLPLANRTTPYCGNITGATSDLCTLTDTNTNCTNKGGCVNVSYLNYSNGGNFNITGNFTGNEFRNLSGSIEWITPSHIFDVDDADIETDLNTYVDIAGDTMTGNLNVSVHNVTTVNCIVFHSGGKICTA